MSRWELADEHGPAQQEMRQAFCQTVSELMEANDRVVMLEADLGSASGTLTTIGRSHPGRYFNVGISEANMMGMAGGLSLRGFVPFVHTFAPFASRRAADQVYLEGAYARNSFTIYASDPGVCAEHNGGTHSSYEDVSLMRAIPEMEVYHPADPVQFAWLVRQLAERPRVHYVRAARKKVAQIYQAGSTFEIGRGNLLADGADLVLVAAGDLLGEALAVREALAERGVGAAVVDMFTLKPFDEELLLSVAAGKQLVVTMENHSVYGGLGGIVAEVLATAGLGVPLRRIGVNDQFGQVGTIDFLKQTYGLTVDHTLEVIGQADGFASVSAN
ncbi:transketolase family protein [Scrofimicrobium sp. R131]|uniref:Transketolase C-terminal domain-containing protein n=1 Tax=Scrofimicrobium appendicitidis TaxID=3079930 RepID=A0AAU7V8L7_9ACTO